MSSRLKKSIIATAITGVALATSAAAASAVTPLSGGGCGNTLSGGGASYKGCISQSSTINFDGYVTSSVSCTAHVTLFRGSQPMETGPDTNCRGTSVHIPGGTWPTQSGYTWHASIFVTDKGNYTAASPNMFT